MKKQSKKLATKAVEKGGEGEAAIKRQCLPLYGAYGILALFVFASIVYSTILICLTYADNYKLFIGLVPQALFAVWIAIYKFSSK